MEQGSVTAGSAPAAAEGRAFVWESIVASFEEEEPVEFTHPVDEPVERATFTSEQQLEVERREENLACRELLNTRGRAKFSWRISGFSSLS